MTKNKKLPDNVEEYFTKTDGSKGAFHSRELLSGDEDNIDLKTDLNLEEIKYINILNYNDEFLKSKGLKPVFTKYAQKYMRLKYSHERKSRQEFVDINKANTTDEAVQLASGISNITGAKK